MKKLLKFLIFIVILFIGIVTVYKLTKDNETMIAIVEYYTRENSVLEKNKWQINNPSSYVKITDNFSPTNRQDLLNIYYTVLASGMKEFTFYCDLDYTDCIDDVKELTENNEALSHINGFIHVYNSFVNISTEFKNNGKITLFIKRLYSDELIEKVENEKELLFNKLYDINKTKIENITTFHDYIIDNTTYDLEYIEKKTNRLSNTAYGPLFENYAICSGYTDLMALLLYKLNIPNIRVSNETHTWNMIYLDDKVLTIDVTYDDPITSDKTDFKRDTYLLIPPLELLNLDKDHYFDQEVYLK